MRNGTAALSGKTENRAADKTGKISRHPIFMGRKYISSILKRIILLMNRADKNQSIFFASSRYFLMVMISSAVIWKA